MIRASRDLFLGTTLVGFALGLQFLAPASPDYAFPLFPEAVLLAIIGFYFSWSKQLSLPLDKTNNLTFRLSERAWLFALIVVVVFWMTSRVGLSLWEKGLGPCRHAAPSLITRGECYVQAAFVQNYSIRQFTTLLFAVCAGGLAVTATRLNALNWKCFAFAVIIISLMHALLGFITYSVGELQLLPRAFMVNSFGMDRFTFVMPNPSWVWPQLAPALAWSVWLILSGSLRAQVISFLGAVALSAAIVMTHQRGGLLLLAVIWGLFLSRLVWTRLQSLTPSFSKKMVFIVGWLVLLVIGSRVILHWATDAVGRGTFHDDNRWTMWKIALSGLIEQSPVWGFGYASWYSKFRELAQASGSPGLSFDTAHNLWVQLLFEHGFIGFIIVSGLMAGVVILAWRNMRRLHHGSLLILLHAAAFLCCSLVQEVDYVRPVLMTHALTWGALLGMPFYLSEKEVIPERKRLYFVVQPQAATAKQLWGVRFVLRLFATNGLVIAILSLAWFARGAFGFEGNGGPEGPMARWLGSQASIPVFGPADFWLFETDFLRKQGKIQFGSRDEVAFELQATTKDLIYLPLRSGGRVIPRRHSLQLEPPVDDAVRQITANIVYPPRLGERLIPLLLTRGAHRPEQDSNSSWIDCTQDCQIALDTALLSGSRLHIEWSSLSNGTPSDKINWSLLNVSSQLVSLNQEHKAEAYLRSGTLDLGIPNETILVSDLQTPEARWTFLNLTSINEGTRVRVILKD